MATNRPAWQRGVEMIRWTPVVRALPSSVWSGFAMCGRTTLTISAEDLRRTFGYTVPAGYRPRYNIAPSQNLLAIRDGRGGRELVELRWGLVPFWADDPSIGNRLINARSETIGTTPAFREAFERRRCLLVVDGFYEWQRGPGGKRPFRIHKARGDAFTLAGLWERWKRDGELIESCTIVTCPPNALVRPLHNRMPVIIPSERREEWLSAESPHEELLELLQPYAGHDLGAYEVSSLVNNPANDVEACIEPVQGEVLSLF